MSLKINIVPRWIIFILDISVCILSLSLAYAIRYNFNWAIFSTPIFNRSILSIVLLNTFAFITLKTYSGIIRYTSAQDTFRILTAVVVSNGLLFLINSVFIVFNQPELIPLTVIIINGLFSFLMLITYRVIIKSGFLYLKNLKLDKKRVIIYGAGEAGVTTKRTLDHDAKVNKNIIAFVDDDLRKIGKSIDGKKILNANELNHLISNNHVDEIIFASYSIPLDRKNVIVENCLAHGVKVRNIPPVEVWIDGHLHSAQIQNINIEELLNRESIQINIPEIAAQLVGKRILVTGAAGSIGSEIVRQLMKFDTKLVILHDQSESALHELSLTFEDTHKERSFHAFIGDVRDVKRMQFLFENYRPQIVYHAAAYKHVPLMEGNPSEAVKTNVKGTKIIADLAVKYGVEKFVMISTDKAVNPTNVMGASKRIAEMYVQSLNNSLINQNFVFNNGLSYINDLKVKPITKFITTRFGNVLGSNGSVIPRFKQQIEKGGPVTVTHPEITRFFMTIPEACRLVLEAGCMGNGGEIFVFDMGKSIKIIDLAKKMIRLAGLVPEKDIEIEYTGLRPGEKLFEELLNDNENTLTTHHEKIMIGKVVEYKFNEIENDIAMLIDLATHNNDQKVVVKMKKLVQEYKSNNSVYEKLDIEE